ncbi:MAG: hypothetical protein P8173_04625 [Gammaproteobacteria bacterium]
MMGKRVLLNVWLAVALLALVWVVWKEPGHAPKPPVAKLTAMSPAAANKIVITNHNGTIILIKQAGAWQLAEPVKVAANGVRVDDLLELLQTNSLSQFPAAGHKLSEYGLAKPAVRLKINDTEILLVPPGAQIDALQLPDRKLSRNDKDEWSEVPAQKGITSEILQGLVKEWHEAQAVRVAPYEKHASQGEVVITLAGQSQPLRFQIVARKPELVLARPEIGMQYYVASEQADRLLSVQAPKPEAATAQAKKK